MPERRVCMCLYLCVCACVRVCARVCVCVCVCVFRSLACDAVLLTGGLESTTSPSSIEPRIRWEAVRPRRPRCLPV